MGEISDRYRRRAEAFEGVVAGAPPERWIGPTPCSNWLARDIVSHVVEMHRIVLHPPVGPVSSTPLAPDGYDALAAFHAARAEAEQVLADPATDPALATEFDQRVSADLPPHQWDLAKATGQDATMERDFVEWLWAGLSSFTAEQWEWMRTPGKAGPGIVIYGPRVPVPDTAPLQDRLLGLMGRDPNWSPG